MKKEFLTLLFVVGGLTATKAQKNAVFREYQKMMVTYAFSDPNPIPNYTNIYPYFRYDGFTDKPVNKAWKAIDLENDYIKVTILPEIGGKIWSAIEKSTGKPFLYENHVVKFRDIAMRGPWTSGGLEPNYGIMGHTPNSVTPVDYLVRTNPDGGVSCIISVLDLLTSTTWTMEINLPKDKAYFSTTSFWFNSNAMEEPYYHWMNAGIKTSGNLEYIFPGNRYLGHEGEYGDWPVNKMNGKLVSFYKNNDFGGYKSYHVFGKYTDFFGAYWHDDDFGVARYSGREEKAGKKIWIWGLSRQGMIWEKLLTDTDGQYSEIQSGRLFNQTASKSSFTPFKHLSFSPGSTDTWTEYWYPVLKTKGMVAASDYGALNLRLDGGFLKVNFCAVQKVDDLLEIRRGTQVVYSKKLKLDPMDHFADSIMYKDSHNLVVRLGGNKLVYDSNPEANVLSRPVDSPKDLDWNTPDGLYIQGKEFMDQKMYPEAAEKLEAALKKSRYFLPALVQYASLKYHNLEYKPALTLLRTALSLNTNDPAANYYYGLVNAELGHVVDAKDGFEIATLTPSFRTAAYSALAACYLKDKNYLKVLEYAGKSLDFNRENILALELKATAFRCLKQDKDALLVLNEILKLQPLNHYARFEKYLLLPTDENKVAFISLIRNEQPIETYLDLADTYYKTGCYEESVKALLLSPSNAMVSYKLAFFHHLLAKPYAGYLTDAEKSTVAFVFPFRSSDQDVLRWAIAEKTGWKPKYLLALLYKDRNRISESKTLFQQCGNLPDFAPFYAARAAMKLGSSDLTDLEKALQLEPDSWRYVKLLSEYQLQQKEGAKALLTVQPFYRAHPQNYVMAIIYAHTLLLNKRYEECTEVLKKTNILPFEGATRSRQLYQVAYLMQALQQIQKGHTQTALRYIDSAREWPENLGVGKPYQENVDERFEDWLSYRCYLQSGKAAEARKYLDKIIAFVPSTENSVRNFSPGNQLLTAWALKKVNGRTSALAWVKEQVKLNENDSTLQAYGNLADDNDEVPEQLGAKELMVLEQLIDIR